MGFLTGGPFYDMIGRTGNNVGRRRKGKNVFSMRPAKSNKPATILQQDQRTKFGLATSWLRKCGSIVKIGFQNYDVNGSEMNEAIKYTLDHAITGVSPNFTLDYSKVLLSKGDLAEGLNLAVVASSAAELDFSWDPGTDPDGALTDRIMILVYCPAINKYTSVIGPVARAAGAYTLSVPAAYSGESVHVWTAFVSENSREVSDSKYDGPVVVL